MTLEQLLERVEKAEAGGNDLDREIAISLGWTPPDAKLPHWRDREGHHWTALPDWSTSIDDALALIDRMLPGWFWRVGKMTAPHWQHGVYQPFWAHIQRTHADHCDRDDEATGYAQSAALALIAAMLRALIAKGGEK